MERVARRFSVGYKKSFELFPRQHLRDGLICYDRSLVEESYVEHSVGDSTGLDSMEERSPSQPSS